jgi:hypothetical protein
MEGCSGSGGEPAEDAVGSVAKKAKTVADSEEDRSSCSLRDRGAAKALKHARIV